MMSVRIGLIFTALLYFLLFAGGAILSLSIGIVQGQLDGGCLLYANGKWYKPYEEGNGCKHTNLPCFIVRWSSTHGPCSFATTMGAISSLYGLGMFVYCMYTLLSRTTRGKDIIIFIPCVVNTLFAVLLLASGGVVSAGFNKFCSDLQSRSDVGKIQNCKQGQTKIAWEGNVDGSKFYDYTNFSLLTAWPLFGIALLLSIVFWVRFYRDLRAKAPEDRETLPSNEVL